MQTTSDSKEKRFYKYLLELVKLTGKTIRDYKDYEKHWYPGVLKEIEGCYVDEECESDDIFLEIHKPVITTEDKTPPYPANTLKEWLDFNFNNEKSIPSFKGQRRYINQHGEEITEAFEKDENRKTLYKHFVREWREWAENLKDKKELAHLYNEYFDLTSRFERDGESLELLFGRGILTWKHPDKHVGIIRSPLITQKLELHLDAEKGVITARRDDYLNHLEQEVLSGVSLPNRNKVEEILSELKVVDIKKDISNIFTMLVHTIDASGTFVESVQDKFDILNKPIIYDESIFMLRVKKTRVLRDDLENILDQLETDNLRINEAIMSLLGDEPDNSKNVLEKDNSHSPLTKNELFFPLESNEQQKEIVNRIERSYGVTVQGPPGTGKTHTIANLVSHFLAEGKRVLITSQKENPLNVLKNKIPEEIQDLCVPVLGGSRGSTEEIEKSINTISEKLGELDTGKLQKNVSYNLKQLDQSKRKEATLVTQLKEYMKKEGTTLYYQGEELFKYDVAKLLAESNINYDWILDDVRIESAFPIDEIEFKELWDVRDKLKKNDLKLYSTTLPKVKDDIMNGESFKQFVENGECLSDKKDIGYAQLKAFNLPHDILTVDNVVNELEKILETQHVTQDEGYLSIINDLKAGGIRESRWRDLVKDLEEKCSQLFHYYTDLVTHTVKLPEWIGYT